MTRPPALTPLNAEWAKRADWILLEYGAVCGADVYRARWQARYRALKAIGLMVRFGLHPRESLREPTDRVDGGWVWTVEYVPPSDGPTPSIA
jgi:hypothetical protein